MAYATAEDLFEAARNAAEERMRAYRQIEAMDAARGLHGVGMGIYGASPDTNRTRGTIDLLDYESSVRSRIESDERLIEYASRVLRGDDGKGGVESLLSSRHADAVTWRYLLAKSWKVCEHALGESDRTLQRLCFETFDMIDAVGFDDAIAGAGLAEG
ncbi:MAG: hypothetical protein Q4B35_06540 [Slackia sp.]|nr:hypothetical protein [Slackia sp.]